MSIAINVRVSNQTGSFFSFMDLVHYDDDEEPLCGCFIEWKSRQVLRVLYKGHEQIVWALYTL